MKLEIDRPEIKFQAVMNRDDVFQISLTAVRVSFLLAAKMDVPVRLPA